MTTPDKPTSFGVIGAQPEDEFEIRTLPDASLIELVDGRVARVIDNPHDGVWLVCEFVDEHEEVQGDAETVLCYDIARLLRSGPAS